MTIDVLLADQDVEDMIAEAKYPDETERVLRFALNKMKANNIEPNLTQVVVLANHISEMIDRAKRHEKLMDVDISLFANVSPEALQIAQAVVDKIGNLAESEKYVLSIHFEAAKNN
ncbi:MAG: PRD domain-containing protein [Bacillota bacterium]|nr:PRD domain-containing protein [Bacillota bacterium]